MPIDSTRIRAVLFDIDGTLRDTDDELVDRVGRLLRPVAGAERGDRLARRTVMALERPTQVVLGAADRVHLDGPLNRVIDYLAPRGATHAVVGAGDVVAALRGRFRLGVVSAGPRGAVHRFLAEHDLASAMEIVVVGQTYRRTKPHPMPIVRAAADLGVPTSAVLMVGDTTVDIEAGRRAGAQTLGVLSGFGRRRDLVHAGADEVVDSVAVLPGLLGGRPLPE